MALWNFKCSFVNAQWQCQIELILCETEAIYAQNVFHCEGGGDLDNKSGI